MSDVNSIVRMLEKAHVWTPEENTRGLEEALRDIPRALSRPTMDDADLQALCQRHMKRWTYYRHLVESNTSNVRWTSESACLYKDLTSFLQSCAVEARSALAAINRLDKRLYAMLE